MQAIYLHNKKNWCIFNVYVVLFINRLYMSKIFSILPIELVVNVRSTSKDNREGVEKLS